MPSRWPSRSDPKVSVEEAIEGTEVGCAITGDASGKLEMGVVDETVVTDGGFFHIHQDQTAGCRRELQELLAALPRPDLR